MKKNTLILTIFLLIIIFYDNNYSQNIDYKRPVNKPLLRLNDFIEKRYNDSLLTKNHRILAIEETQLKGLKYFSENNKFFSNIPEWKNIGPFDIGGRVRSVAVSPTDKNIIYAGAAAGGIWKSTNGGALWKPIFDFQNATSFGALCIDPNNSSTIYAATGEMVIGGGITYLGNGIYKSTDAGESWFQLGLTNVAAFSKIIVHPLNSNLIIATGAIRNGGIYISTNAGQSWQNKYEGNITDLSINPQDVNEIIAGVNIKGVIYSSDGGENWEIRSNGLNDLGGRISVQGYEKNFNILYALIERNDGKGAVYKSTDKGKNWVISLNGNSSFFNSQGYYNNFISIHPNNSNIVLTGGIDLWRTSNGGSQWEIVNERTRPARMHVDQHCAVFSISDNNTVFVGNDGGVYKSTDAGFSWTDANQGLMITQFYAMNIDLLQKNRNFGGTQDNGTLGNPSSNWKMLVGGDGFDCFLHPANPDILFGEIYYGEIFRYDINNNNLKFLKNGLPEGDNGLWHSPFVLDKKNHTMYLGKNAIYVSYDYGENFFQITAKGNHQYSAIEPSKSNSRIIFAGNRMGQIILTTNAGINWISVNSPILPGKFITDITSSSINDSLLFVSFAGYGNKHIFKSTNLGFSWKAIDNNLPDVPVNSIALHPENEQIIFVATDIGVYVSNNGGNDWQIFGNNLPRTPILDLKFHTNRILLPNLTLRAATYGRSIWEIEVPNSIIAESGILTPAGGENYAGNTIINTAWFGFDLPVRIEFSSDGTSFNLIKDTLYSNSFKFQLPDENTFNCKIRITSISSPNSRTSNTFSIFKKQNGSVLSENAVGFNSYGITFIDKNELGVLDYRTGNILIFNTENYSVLRKIIAPVKGLYTDLTYSKQTNEIFLHKMDTENGAGAEIIIIDTSGNLKKRINSPAKYPMGIHIDENYLYFSERDNEQLIYKMKLSDYSIVSTKKNATPFQYAPRCFTIKDGLIHQVTTYFNADVLTKAEITVFEIETGKIILTVPLNERTGIMNARGIDIDPIDGNYWVSNFNGGLFKIYNSFLTSIKDEIPVQNNFNFYPNPAEDFITVWLDSEPLNDFDYKQKLIIVNQIGEKVKEILFDNNSSFHRIDVSDIPTGFYYIRIGTKFQKLIKL